jgi:hypothetical protein
MAESPKRAIKAGSVVSPSAFWLFYSPLDVLVLPGDGLSRRELTKLINI